MLVDCDGRIAWLMDVDGSKPKEFNLTISDFAGDGEDAGASGGSWKLDGVPKLSSSSSVPRIIDSTKCST